MKMCEYNLNFSDFIQTTHPLSLFIGHTHAITLLSMSHLEPNFKCKLSKLNIKQLHTNFEKSVSLLAAIHRVSDVGWQTPEISLYQCFDKVLTNISEEHAVDMHLISSKHTLPNSFIVLVNF